MILSMTGFGRITADCGPNRISAEIKSLNSKQLDLQMRVPSLYRELEPRLRAIIAERLNRGKIDLTINIDTSANAPAVVINLAAMTNYKLQIESMCSQLNIPAPQDWVSQLMRMPDAIHTEMKTLSEQEANEVAKIVTAAAEALTDSRTKEGAKLESFFENKIEAISMLLTQVEPFEQERVARIRERLEAHLAKLSGVDIDKGRLEQELIFYIEKLDVTEEKTRLRAHLAYFLETMSGEPGQGKKLGFIAQEMGREINTLGSKANNADMQRIVVKMKDELEQIKEQVLNVL